MPIYEFYCPANNTLYSFLARTLAYQNQVPACPDDPALPMEKRVSRFAIIGKAREDDGQDPFADLDDTKMEALMAEMEGEMETMDTANPNPRQLGRFMRRLTDLMGDKTPAELKEIVKRLEAGEDPEKLEHEFGDLDEDGGGDAIFTQVKKMIRHARQPVRDPKLYEMSDWVRKVPA